ncbi:kinesin-like protein KIN-4A isoform X5 [Juglans microcarpa x Juglans regia]|uniref:kinesin-like protein KIN-4A isoform X5 n=1 Tax=Juglans microcarpa x Juglans regia TaxID=2249226 RepID=UPI001B7DB37B|nr:kinesin-like protein KIN-4A isoform X5 [Juglans microcarpa x Juglans regia]
MDTPENCCVKVAVHIRPLIADERLHGCKECVTVTPRKNQVQIGTHSFTFDHVYGSSGSPSSAMFEECIAALVDGLFQGYNGTVLAYGQTGSGKTYTMGTSFKDGCQTGLIPQVMNALFNKIKTLNHQTEFQLHVSFIEILKEEVRDLLDSVAISKLDTAKGHAGKVAIDGRQLIQIRETSKGAITLAGSTEVTVTTLQEMATCLEQGSLSRATGSTNMNNQSSRSHAIFTITLEQMQKLRLVLPRNDTSDEEMGEEYFCAKLHLVDLAGSERAKRTGSDGLRFKEGIHINKGLLALGNVISALGDEKKRKEGVHVPYRDSKLTRLLQDSLGGNSKTVMIACISPADINAEESLNTLKYANRARNIQNKPVINRDIISNEMQKMQQQLKYLQAELYARGEGVPSDEVQVLKDRIGWLEATNRNIFQELHEYRSRCGIIQQDEIDAQEIQIGITKSDGLKRGFQSMDLSDYQIVEAISGENLREFDEVTKEWEHALLQDTMDKELNELNELLEQKESEMKLLGGVDTEALKQRLGKKILELEEEKRIMQQERDCLLAKVENLAANFDGRIPKVQETQAQKFKALEAQVQLQHKIKQVAEQFRQWKTSREKELLQLRKEGRRNEYERHKLESLNQRQKMVLQRKTEEAAMATRRLKELLEARKPAARDHSGTYVGHTVIGQGNEKPLQRWLDHELEVMVNVHEVRFEYEKQSQVQAALAEELALMKQVDQFSFNGQSPPRGKNGYSRLVSMPPNARMARIASLENMLSMSSNALMAMATQLSEAKERERASIGRGRWNHLRSMGDAKNLLQYMFDAAAEARCQLWEKNLEIKETKEQLKELVFLVQQSEAQRKQLIKEQQAREQAVAVDSGSSASLADDMSGPLSPMSLPVPKQLKFTPGIVNGSVRESATFLDQTQKMVPVGQLSMKKLAAVGQAAKLWRWKRSHHQWLLQFKWRWQKPWRLSEWIKHCDETIIRSRPRPPVLVDSM